MNNNKITLQEFFRNKDLLGIHCNTEEKAKALLKEFDKWYIGTSYSTDNCWNFNKEDTIYYNDNSYANLKYAKSNHHKIYEFEDIIFE